MNILKLAKLIPAMKEGLKLAKLLESRTTKEQWKGTAVAAVVVCVIIAIARTTLLSYGFEIPEEVWVGVASAVLAAASPLMSRIASFADAPVLKLGDVVGVEAFRVMKKGMQSWRNYDGTMGEALEAGFDYAVDPDGMIYDLRKCEYTGGKSAISDAARKRHGV